MLPVHCVHPSTRSQTQNLDTLWLTLQNQKIDRLSIQHSKTEPGAFYHASLIEKVARIVLAIFLIIATLGLILLFLSVQDLVDLKIKSLCTKQKSMHHQPSKETHLPANILSSLLMPVLIPITGECWDNYAIAHHCQKLHMRYPTFLIQGPQPIASCFSLERLLFLDLHLYNSREQTFLTQPDMAVCEHKSYEHGYLKHTPCESLRIFAYPLWHHPLATTEEEIIQKMLTAHRLQSAEISHWCLVIVNLDLREVIYFDSLACFIQTQLIDSKLKEIAERLEKQFPSPKSDTPFTIKKVVQTPIQEDGFSCGIWVTIFLEKYLENPRNLPEIIDTLQNHKHSILKDFLNKNPNPSPPQSNNIT
ncbi:Ulp1 family isopeptidase [Chlamydia gallinacea]|uniref:Ulp1 family isopeptidase n=1 Tax=Chlamydia gallinacea TaxID=1457153 RepID=UPI0024E1CBC2|nr:Ulp1 family isopeptidase [Chlamydia gallinacea]